MVDPFESCLISWCISCRCNADVSSSGNVVKGYRFEDAAGDGVRIDEAGVEAAAELAGVYSEDVDTELSTVAVR